jgi:type II secretory pathway pseudopilin PulG
LVELLVVILIIGLLAALLLPALRWALCQGKAAKASVLIDQLSQAAKAYEYDHNAYPPHAADFGSRALVAPLAAFGPRNLPYFTIDPGDVTSTGDIQNLVDPATEILRYRNNAANWPGNASDPTAHNKTSADMWGRDCAGTVDGIRNW